MHVYTVISLLCAIILAVINNSAGAPAENTSLRSGSDGQGVGQPFDEIVVESTLNVKRKDGSRQSRNNQAGAVRTKRQNGFPSFNFPQFPAFGGSVADASAQAQSHNAKAGHGNFGASAAGGQSQSLAFGPNGPVGSASFAGSQQYKLPNGETFDVSFGNAVGGSATNKAGGAAIAINGPRG